MPSAAAVRRRRSANNARIAAKQRRQRILVVVLAVVLVALLAYQVPKLLERSGGNSSAAVAGAPASSSPKPAGKRLPRGGTGADPFAVKSLPDGDARAVTASGPDPFTGTSSSSSSAASSTAALPTRIVIGQPGGNRVAKRGWIVILASIPTGNGRSTAARFAREARRTVGGLSVLNSSNRRPLRGGYWVVYSGPYSTLAAVSRRADSIHAAGYRSAYVRELIAYR